MLLQRVPVRCCHRSRKGCRLPTWPTCCAGPARSDRGWMLCGPRCSPKQNAPTRPARRVTRRPPPGWLRCPGSRFPSAAARLPSLPRWKPCRRPDGRSPQESYPSPGFRLLAQAQALAPEQFAHDEAALVAQASTVSSKQLPQAAGRLEAPNGSRGSGGGSGTLARRSGPYTFPIPGSGCCDVSGDLDPEGGLQVLAAIQALADPAALDPSDTRTPAQRQADALVEICRRHSMGTGKPTRQQPAAVLVTIPWNTLEVRQGDRRHGGRADHADRRRGA